MSIAILVMSCDKNADLWKPYHLCMEKYWKNHPPIYYSTETKRNPYYHTICKNYSVENWTRRIWDTINEINVSHIILMVDDIFIREKVDNNLIYLLSRYVSGNIASLNFEKSFDNEDFPLNDIIYVRNPRGKYKTSVMFQMWQKKVMLDLFNIDTNPWTFEKLNHGKSYQFLISKYGDFVDWGYKDRKWFGIRKGKWCKECKRFFDKENIEIDYSIRGFCE